jgi:hypothetical protein
MSKDFVINALQLLDDEAILQTGTKTTDAVKLTTNANAKGTHGSFAIHFTSTLAGAIDIVAETSANGGSSFVPQPTKVVEGTLAGEYHVAFTTPLSTDIRLKITETGVGPATITELFLAYQ